MKKYVIIAFALVFMVSLFPTTTTQAFFTAPAGTAASNPECTATNPCNTVTQNSLCPAAWMGHKFTDSYHRNVSGSTDLSGVPWPDQEVCDYAGKVTHAQCISEKALTTVGPHGQWCQKFINNNTILLSLGRGDVETERSTTSQTEAPVKASTETGSNTGGTKTDIPPAGINQCASLTKNIGYGSRDVGDFADVSMLQDFLSTNGYLRGTSTGFFGKATLGAVKAFQSANGITPTGYVGTYTRAAITKIDCDSTQ